MQIAVSTRGFTLTEMLVCLVIFAILVAFAVSSFQKIIDAHRLEYEANDLRGHIELARTEAIKRGAVTVVCPSRDAATCSDSTNWEKGWIVFATDSPALSGCDITAPDASQIIKKRDPFTVPDTLVFNPDSANKVLCFTRAGLPAKDYSGWFSINKTPVDASVHRCVSLSGTGRSQIIKHDEEVKPGVNCT